MRTFIYKTGVLFLTLTILLGCGVEPEPVAADRQLDRKVDSVVALMTPEEKMGQLSLLTSDWDVTGPVMRPQYMEDIR